MITKYRINMEQSSRSFDDNDRRYHVYKKGWLCWEHHASFAKLTEAKKFINELACFPIFVEG